MKIEGIVTALISEYPFKFVYVIIKNNNFNCFKLSGKLPNAETAAKTTNKRKSSKTANVSPNQFIDIYKRSFSTKLYRPISLCVIIAAIFSRFEKGRIAACVLVVL